MDSQEKKAAALERQLTEQPKTKLAFGKPVIMGENAKVIWQGKCQGNEEA